MSSGNGIIAETREKIQTDLDTLLAVLEDVQGVIPEGAYLRGMNALGSLHRHKQTALTAIRPGAILCCWNTLEEIEEEDEDIYDEIMEVADDIVVELCGQDSSIYSDERYNLVHRGNEQETFQALMDYKPREGNAGYETSPMVLHHAIQVIMERLFNDTYHELEIVRPVSCQCGWRGAQGNWDRHIRNMRHQRWVDAESEKRQSENAAREAIFQSELARARELVSELFTKSRRENGMIYFKQEDVKDSRAFKQAIEDFISAWTQISGERVIFVSGQGELSWFT
jgi:hypothetical protein